MPYRSDQPAIVAALTEQRELTDLARDARFRRTRAGLALGAAFSVLFAAVCLLFRIRVPHSPGLHCHRVEVRYFQEVGTPPPPASWTACEWR
jgi:hypothetical protein